MPCPPLPPAAPCGPLLPFPDWGVPRAPSDFFAVEVPVGLVRPRVLSGALSLPLWGVVRRALEKADPCCSVWLLPLLAPAEIAAPFPEPVCVVLRVGAETDTSFPLDGVADDAPAADPGRPVWLFPVVAAAETAVAVPPPARFVSLGSAEISPPFPEREGVASGARCSLGAFAASSRPTTAIPISGCSAETMSLTMLDNAPAEASSAPQTSIAATKAAATRGRERAGMKRFRGDGEAAHEDDRTIAAIMATISSSPASSEAVGSDDAASRSRATPA